MYRECFLLFCFVAVSQQIKISNFEVPDAVKVGEDVELKCEIEGKEGPGFVLKWWFSPFENEVVYPIYQRITGREPMVSPKFTDSISIKENSLDNLELKNAQPEHSGQYQCHVSSFEDDEIRKSDDLFVYTPGSGPMLNITVIADSPDDNDTQDDVIAKCEALNVAPEPVLTIYGESGEFDDIYENRTSSVDGLYSVFKSVILSNVTQDTIYCKMSYVLFNVTDAESVLFLVNETYNAPGAMVITTEGEPSTSELPTADPITDSSSVLCSSWALWLFTAMMVRLLAQ